MRLLQKTPRKRQPHNNLTQGHSMHLAEQITVRKAIVAKHKEITMTIEEMYDIELVGIKLK